MSIPRSSFSLQVDVTNPGEFFACCGLLELAQRLSPRAEGLFSNHDTCFSVFASAEKPTTLSCVIERLREIGIEGELSKEERSEFEQLESRKRALARKGRKLQESEEERRSWLGKRRREGALTLNEPFNMRVQWWQEDGEDIPKTFAGRQEVLRIALAMLAKLPDAVQVDRPLAYRCLLHAVSEESRETDVRQDSRKQRNSKVEPFYFDARRFASKLDAGFSLDVQEQTLRATAAPLTELLALIGLQRFRPAAAGERWTFQYWTWMVPLSSTAAAAVVCGAAAVPGRKGYQFKLRFRDDQKRYKAFGYSTPIGGNA